MPFDPQPTLIGEVVHLRPMRPSDFEPLYAVASDPLIWEQHPASNRWQRDVFTKFFDEGIAQGGALVALDAKDGRMIGSSRYWDYDPVKRTVEIGWTFLARACWGGRYNQDMKRLMLQHAFPYVDRVLFIIGPQNWRSRKAVEKIGGRFLENAKRDGDRDVVIYSLTEADCSVCR